MLPRRYNLTQFQFHIDMTEMIPIYLTGLNRTNNF